MRELVMKNCDLRRLKGDTYTKKMRPNRSILVNLWGFSVLLKITKKPYFITLSPAFLGPEGPLEWTEGSQRVFSTQ